MTISFIVKKNLWDTKWHRRSYNYIHNGPILQYTVFKQNIEWHKYVCWYFLFWLLSYQSKIFMFECVRLCLSFLYLFLLNIFYLFWKEPKLLINAYLFLWNFTVTLHLVENLFLHQTMLNTFFNARP